VSKCYFLYYNHNISVFLFISFNNNDVIIWFDNIRIIIRVRLFFRLLSLVIIIVLKLWNEVSKFKSIHILGLSLY